MLLLTANASLDTSPHIPFDLLYKDLIWRIEKYGRICYQTDARRELVVKALLDDPEFTGPMAADFAEELGPDAEAAIPALRERAEYRAITNFIRERLMKSGHHSVIEHGSISAVVVCDRGVTHEIVRHRLAAYSQESTRYCRYGKDGRSLQFIIPPWCRIEEGEYSIDGLAYPLFSTPGDARWFEAMRVAEYFYLKLLEEGWRPEQARDVLPNSTKTQIAMTYNLREWRHFLRMRASRRAHPQMQPLAIDLLRQLKANFPIFFEDFTIEDDRTVLFSGTIL